LHRVGDRRDLGVQGRHRGVGDRLAGGEHELSVDALDVRDVRGLGAQLVGVRGARRQHRAGEQQKDYGRAEGEGWDPGAALGARTSSSCRSSVLGNGGHGVLLQAGTESRKTFRRRQTKSPRKWTVLWSRMLQREARACSSVVMPHVAPSALMQLPPARYIATWMMALCAGVTMTPSGPRFTEP